MCERRVIDGVKKKGTVKRDVRDRSQKTLNRQMNYKLVGKSSKSVIRVTENSIRVYRLAGTESSQNMIGIVTIIPGIQLELGRSIREFVNCLKMIGKPIAIQKIFDRNNQCTWNLIRMATGNIPEVVICSIGTINDRMVNVAFNQELPYNKKYRQHQKLSIEHKINAGKREEPGCLANAVKIVSVITKVPTTSFKIRSNKNVTYIYSNIKDLDNQIKVTFAEDRRGYFKLMGIGIVNVVWRDKDTKK